MDCVLLIVLLAYNLTYIKCNTCFKFRWLHLANFDSVYQRVIHTLITSYDPLGGVGWNLGHWDFKILILLLPRTSVFHKQIFLLCMISSIFWQINLHCNYMYNVLHHDGKINGHWLYLFVWLVIVSVLHALYRLVHCFQVPQNTVYSFEFTQSYFRYCDLWDWFAQSWIHTLSSFV